VYSTRGEKTVQVFDLLTTENSVVMLNESDVMRVLFSISYYHPYVSGLSLYAKRLAFGLVAKGYQVTVLATQHMKSLTLHEKEEGIDIVRVPYLFRFSKGFFMPLFLLRSFQEVRKADIICVHLPQFEGIVISFLTKLFNKKLVCIYHCEVQLPRFFGHRLIENVLHLSNMFSLFLADTVVTYTDDFANHAKLLNRVKQKVKTVYPPIPVPMIDQQKKKEFDTVFASLKKTIRIGVAARIASEKGIEYLLQAIPVIEKQLERKVSILFAGPKNPVGEERYLQTITPLLKKYEEKIHFVGSLSQKEMGAFYSFLDVLVLPSTNSTESFGMVQVEAMFMGVPVVVSNLPGVRVPVQLTKMGELVKIADSSDLAEKITKVVAQRKQYIKSQKEVVTIFSYDKTIEFYQDVLQRL